MEDEDMSQEEGAKLIKYQIFVPESALSFARENGIELDVQEIFLSALAGYFTSFASLSPGSRFPLAESRELAKQITEVRIQRPVPCSFCALHSLDPTKEKLSLDLPRCSFLDSSQQQRIQQHQEQPQVQANLIDQPTQ